mmetsp:Transcript_26277/g.55921  ORF Transcript_26277/g.55921 Transcript_26277/m.55921 type:complete len:211 (+) Transcript_26277:506-1138(+)
MEELAEGIGGQYNELLTRRDGFGIALFMYSVLMSRGLKNIRELDADDAGCTMIGAHGYCTQELVNLFVVGRAFTNVFDGSKRLGELKGDAVVLQGIHKRSPVGFLSYHEHFKDIEVGSRLKGPQSAVWIMCCESHYSLLFQSDAMGDPKDSTFATDLVYFDPLGRGTEMFRIRVRPGELPESDTTSVIERTLRTKWIGAAVEWIGCERLL